MVSEDALRVRRVTAPVRTQVTEKLRQAIREMRFEPGQHLVERELVELTGVSRTSVREALRELATEGLVTAIPNKGTVVAVVSREEARQIYELRATLEALAGRLFVEHASDNQTKNLREASQAIQDAVASDDDLLAAKDRFYQVLFEGAGNEPLRQAAQMLHARITVLRSLSLSRAGRPRDTLREIHKIVEAVEQRDAEAAAQACSHHVDQAGRTALAALPAD